MIGDPRWILSVLDDLLAYAAENCRSEIGLHLEGAQRHLRLYLSDDPPPPLPDPEVQIARDVLDDMVSYAQRHGMKDVQLHLVAARRKLIEHEAPAAATGNVITLPVLPRRSSDSQGT